MSAEIKIERRDSETGGEYAASVAGRADAGELTYRRTGPGVVVAQHTGVRPDLQGHGVALKLVERLIADARAEGFKIVAACTYVAAQKKRHPEWADVFATS